MARSWRAATSSTPSARRSRWNGSPPAPTPPSPPGCRPSPAPGTTNPGAGRGGRLPPPGSALATALRESHPKVACVGTYIVDVLGRPVSALPPAQGSTFLEEIRMTPAGTAGGTSVDLARLGARVVAVGAIGRDTVADFLVGALGNAGVDSTFLVRKDGVQTSASILPIPPDGSRLAWHVPGANSAFGPDDVPWDVLAGCAAVHLGGLTRLPGIDGEPAGRILAYGREHGALTTADCLG